MAYILGRQEFWSREFAVGPGVLVPRADTETLIEAAVAAFPDPARPLRLLDVGVGSGCLVLTLLARFAHARGVATDLSAAALAAPPQRLQPRADGPAALVRTIWARGVAAPFDLVVSNPPYIPRPRSSGWSRRWAVGAARRPGRRARWPGGLPRHPAGLPGACSRRGAWR